MAMVAAILVALNMRPAVTSVAAVLDDAARVLGLGPIEVTVLAALPVIAFGASAPIGPRLARSFGVERVLLWSMLMLSVALVLRAFIPVLLLPGTFLAGAAIMAAGTLLPQYLKSIRATGLQVGLSSMSFGVGAALGAAVVVPVSTLTGGDVRVPWGLWAGLAVLAAVPLFVRLRVRGRDARTGSKPTLRFTRASVTTIVLLTAVFSLQAMLYFAVTAWMPQFLASHGHGTAERGGLLSWFSVAGFVPTLLIPLLTSRPRVLRWVAPALGALIAAGLCALFLAQPAQVVWVVGGLGAVQSAAFGLAIALIVSMSADPVTAGVVSAIAQGAGYAVAGIGSLLIGLLHSGTGRWAPSFAVMMAVALVLSAVTAYAIRRPRVSLT